MKMGIKAFKEGMTTEQVTNLLTPPPSEPAPTKTQNSLELENSADLMEFFK